MIYKEIPAPTRALLDRILAILPGAVIAGGFIRDTLLGIEPRDVDVLTDTMPTPEQVADLGRFLSDDPKAMRRHECPDCDEDYASTEDRKSKIEALYQGGGVDLIVVTNVKTHIEEFPDNISRVSYSNGQVHMGFGFDEGHQTKVMTYRDAAGPTRLLKLIEKFPAYSVAHE